MTYATARAITAGETTKLHSDGQFTKIRMCVVPQQTILACKASGSLVSNDAVTTVPYNTVTSGSASFARVVNGMTCYVGSGSGLGDLGMVRVKYATASVLTIARVSGINWQSNVFLTVVDDFGLWAKLPTLDLTKVNTDVNSGDTGHTTKTTVVDLTRLYMDDNIIYSNQNANIYPVPVMGPDNAVPYTSGSVVLDGSNSYTLDGSTINSYTWGITNGSAASGSVVASGSAGVSYFLFPAPGSYIVSLTVASTNGKSVTGHRNCYVYAETGAYAPVDQITLQSMSGDRDNGWKCEVKAWDGVSIPTVRDRTKVIVISQDYYSGSAGNFGQVAGAENVMMTGWVGEENTKYDREISTVSFTIYGAAYWLKKVTGPSTFLENVTSTPAAWTSFNNLTMDKIVHHFMYWRSTAIEIMDVYPSNNTRIIGGMSASIGNIWDQLVETAETRMLTVMAVDRFGRFFTYLDPQIIPLANRAAIPTVQAIVKDDLMDVVDITRTVVNPVALLEVAGLAVNGNDVLMFMGRAPGSLIYNRFGDNDVNDRLVVNTQSDTNTIAGMLLAKKNNEYGQVNLTMAQINKMIDIAPAMYVTLTVDAADTNRGFAFTAKKFLPTSIDYKIKEDTGSMVVEITGEGETSGDPGYTVQIPQEPIYNLPKVPKVPVYPIIPITPILPEPFLPRPISSGSSCPNSAPANGPYDLFISGVMYQNDVSNSKKVNYPCTVRSNAHTYLTAYTLTATWQKFSSGSYVATTDDAFYNVYAVNASGSRVATGTHDAVVYSTIRTGYFNIPANVEVAGFEVALTPDVFAPVAFDLHFDEITASGSGVFTHAATPYGVLLQWRGGNSSAGRYNRFLRNGWNMTGESSYAYKWFTISWKSYKRVEYISGTYYGLFPPMSDAYLPFLWWSAQIDVERWQGWFKYIDNAAVMTDWQTITMQKDSTSILGIWRDNGIVSDDASYKQFCDIDIIVTNVSDYKVVLTGLTVFNVCPPGSA